MTPAERPLQSKSPAACGAFLSAETKEFRPLQPDVAPASVDLAAGRVQLGMIGFGSAKGQIAAGQVRVLAVAAPTRLAALPEVPTFEQAGVSGYDVTNWLGVLAPKGTPRDVIRTLNSHIGQAFENPQVAQRLADVGVLPMKESVEQFQKRIMAEHAKWRDIVRNAGITAQCSTRRVP